MKINKKQLRRIIQEEKQRLHEKSRMKKEVDIMTQVDQIATAIENVAKEVYGMSGPGTVSGDAGDELGRILDLQVQKLNRLYTNLTTHFGEQDDNLR